MEGTEEEEAARAVDDREWWQEWQAAEDVTRWEWLPMREREVTRVAGNGPCVGSAFFGALKTPLK